MTDEQLEALVSRLLDHVAELVVVVDQTGLIRFASKRAEVILQMPASDWIGRPVFEIMHPDDLALGLELMVSAKATGAGVKEPVTFRLQNGSGDWTRVEVMATNVDLGTGGLAIVLSGREVSGRRSASAIIDDASERLSRMFEDAPIGMAQTGLDGRFLRINRSFADMLGLTPADLTGRLFAELLLPDDAVEARAGFARLVAGEIQSHRRSAQYVRSDGRIVHAEVTSTLVRDRHGVPLYCAAQAIDITELREAQAEVLYRSTHDALTGLANRSLLLTQLSQALARAARTNAPTAVIFLDLDGFKAVNDTHGHAAGDELLVDVARRITEVVRHGDVAARLGGDEFVVMCEAAERASVRQVATRLAAALSEPFQLSVAEVRIGVSVGVAIESAGGVTADELILHADTALYRAKRQGRGRIRYHRTVVGSNIAVDDVAPADSAESERGRSPQNGGEGGI